MVVGDIREDLGKACADALRGSGAAADFVPLDVASEASWERAIPLVRMHIRLRRDPPPVEAIRAFLDRAARRAAEDDRVWLGKAILAIQTGSYAEAARWLDACQRRRPEDVPVWRARLNWARATNQVEVVRQAAEHLPRAGSSPALVQDLAAWLAAAETAEAPRSPGGLCTCRSPGSAISRYGR